MVYVVFDITYRGTHRPFHSIEATPEDAERVVEELRKTSSSTYARTLIYFKPFEFGEVTPAVVGVG